MKSTLNNILRFTIRTIYVIGLTASFMFIEWIGVIIHLLDYVISALRNLNKSLSDKVYSVMADEMKKFKKFSI